MHVHGVAIGVADFLEFEVVDGTRLELDAERQSDILDGLNVRARNERVNHMRVKKAASGNLTVYGFASQTQGRSGLP